MKPVSADAPKVRCLRQTPDSIVMEQKIMDMYSPGSTMCRIQKYCNGTTLADWTPWILVDSIELKITRTPPDGAIGMRRTAGYTSTSLAILCSARRTETIPRIPSVSPIRFREFELWFRDQRSGDRFYSRLISPVVVQTLIDAPSHPDMSIEKFELSDFFFEICVAGKDGERKSLGRYYPGGCTRIRGPWYWCGQEDRLLQYTPDYQADVNFGVGWHKEEISAHATEKLAKSRVQFRHDRGVSGLCLDFGLVPTDFPLEDLAHIRTIPKVAVIRLSEGISDEGMTHLSGLSDLNSLSILSHKLTDVGLQQLRDLPALKTIEIHSKLVTDDGVASVKKRFPECEIVRRP